jgi:hypothetical protein
VLTGTQEGTKQFLTLTLEGRTPCIHFHQKHMK